MINNIVMLIKFTGRLGSELTNQIAEQVPVNVQANDEAPVHASEDG